MRRTNLTLTLVAVVAVGALFAVLFAWRDKAASTDYRLCNVIYRLVARSAATFGKPGTPGYAYYHAHPSELEAARAQNRLFLEELNCRHLPTGGKP